MKQLYIKLGVFILCFSSLMHASSTHTHGEATASMIIESNNITIQLSIPSESIVGFEHIAKTDEEIQAIQNATQTLKNNSLFRFYEFLGIFKKQQLLEPVEESIHVMAPLKKISVNHDHHHDHKKDMHHHEETNQDENESHSNFDIKLSYLFNDASKIKIIESRLLELLPLLKKVNTIVVTDTNQNEFILTKYLTTVKLESNEEK